MYPSWRQIDVPMSDFKGAKRKRCVSHFTLRWLSKKCKVAKTLCELATCLGVGPQDHKDRLLFRRRLEHFAQRGELNSVSVGGPWPGVVLIHHMPGWDEWIRSGKRKRVSAVLLAWRAERLWGLLIAGKRLHPEGQPRELFADNPQLVLRGGFAEPVDQPDQRADVLLGQFKELVGCLGHRTSSGRTATVSHGSSLRTETR